MKKILYSALALSLALLTVGCSKDDNGNKGDGLVRTTLTFEGAEWDALVDSKQYGGDLLYGDGGAVYSWYDEDSDLCSALNNGAWSHDYSAGGCAVSNYYSNDYEANANYTEQLTVYGTGAHSGKNCIVCYGYNGVYGDSCPVIDFATDAAYIESAYVNLTTYSFAVATKGNGYAKALTEKEFIKVVATGYTLDAGGKETEASTAEFYLYKDGKAAINGWTKWDLKSLGKINRVKFNMQQGDDKGVYSTDFAHPAYFALDDVTVAREEK